jgi:hypothetical protein
MPTRAEETGASGQNCSFRTDPDAYLTREARERQAVFDRTTKSSLRLASATDARSVDPATLPRRNFIDVEIFDRLAQARVASAPLTTDEEFIRRVYLDLVGRIPSPEDVREFLAKNSEDKRRALIDRLLYSPEFTDRWTMWMGDLLGNVIATVNINRAFRGRNAFHAYIRKSLHQDKPLKDMVWEMLTARGNSYQEETGAVNYIIGGRQTMGPNQDVYDYMLYQASEKFLGVSHFDCLLCHDGRRHLDDLSLWGKNQTRIDAQRMAAFFSRANWTQIANRDDPDFQAWVVTDRATGNYTLNTTFGNRPNRVRIGTIAAVDAEYRDGTKPASGEWRVEFAENVMRDPLLAINFANRIWKAMFNYALAEPVNSLDPARLDPDNPPEAPWALQASHPKLLQRLAAEMVQRNYNLREFVRVIAESSAYQLSTRYDGQWNVSHVPLFARHYPRRLEGEEIHDAIVKATGMFTPYTVQGWSEATPWACQLPDPQEPRSNGGSLNFMNNFLRGNRDALTRSQAGSILQQLGLMNDAFVTNRTRVAASPVLRAASQMSDDSAAIEELFLSFLARLPTRHERDQAGMHLAKATNANNRNAYLEDLAWALINKVEFIFSY